MRSSRLPCGMKHKPSQLVRVSRWRRCECRRRDGLPCCMRPAAPWRSAHAGGKGGGWFLRARSSGTAAEAASSRKLTSQT